MKNRDRSVRTDRLIVTPGKPFKLADRDPAHTDGFKDKDAAADRLAANVIEMERWQDMLFACRSHAVLLIFQAMDAAGKDGTIKHVMSGLNPQGVDVHSFKAPTPLELQHDFLWRSVCVLPERGRIGIFNRSYYEEVLVVRVHPELLNAEGVPAKARGKDLWHRRFELINNFEKHLSESGVVVVKFFLHVSKEEQRRRFLARIDEPAKNWKFSEADAAEREYWDLYQAAYEDAIAHTSTERAPWYVVPSDHKWFTRLAVSEIIVRTLEGLRIAYPAVDATRLRELKRIHGRLVAEGTK